MAKWKFKTKVIHTYHYCNIFLEVYKLHLKFPSKIPNVRSDSSSWDFMPSHIKHMDKMHKISVISNSSMSQLSFGISFILKNFILKNWKFHCLVWNCPIQMRKMCALDVVKVVDCLVHCWWSLPLVAGGAHMHCH